MDAPIGAPPTLEWIAVERLAIDESYQRATDSSRSRCLIFRIKTHWNWNYCQPLVVSRRADGSLFVVDGQHRLTAAIEREDIPHLPCVVISATDSCDEARAFVAMNTQRQRLSQGDIFNAMLASGDEVAKRVADLLGETGWRMAHSSNTENFKPGDLFCAPMIVRALKAEGETIVRNALSALREAYAQQPVTNAATMLKALFLIYRRGQAGDPDLLIETLAGVPADEWEMEGFGERQRNPQLSRIEGVSAAVLTACRESVADAKLAA